MKTYNERLPLIDATVEELSGEFPPTAIGYSGRSYYAKGDAASILYKINFGDVCTRQEFEQRVNQWRNIYEWGMETDQVTFEDFLSNKGMKDWAIACAEQQDFDWQDTLSQRPETQNVSEILKSNNNSENVSMNNDWYEKGENPPVGAKVMATSKNSTTGEYRECEVIAITNQMCVLSFLKDGKEMAVYTHNYIFEPLHTETDKLVEDVEKILDGCESVSNKAIAHAIINADYRKIKPMSEDEFVDYAIESWKGIVSTRKWIELYRAGCRFLDTSNG